MFPGGCESVFVANITDVKITARHVVALIILCWFMLTGNEQVDFRGSLAVRLCMTDVMLARLLIVASRIISRLLINWRYVEVHTIRICSTSMVIIGYRLLSRRWIEELMHFYNYYSQRDDSKFHWLHAKIDLTVIGLEAFLSNINRCRRLMTLWHYSRGL